MKRPTIENAAEGWTHITNRVVIPPRFTAVFNEELHVSLDVGVTDGTPNLLSVKIERLTGPLRARDLRLPLLTDYVPAALAAACWTLHSGSLDDLTSDGPSGSERVVVIAHLAANASLHNDAATKPKKLGRPRKTNVTLAEVVQVYKRLQKIDSTARLLGLSPATVCRRLDEAKKAGLLPATKGGATQSAAPTKSSDSSSQRVEVTFIPAGTAAVPKQTSQHNKKPRTKEL
ncbi:MAG: hypothetical protein ABL953_12925 [Ilumatobacteraceae bacterium]